jgi:hypothetical protein
MKITSRKAEFRTSAGLKLIGRRYYPEDHQCKAHVFIIPGFSQIGKERFLYLQKYLARRNVSSVVFDFQGIGESEGLVHECTINDYCEPGWIRTIGQLLKRQLLYR